MVVDTVLQLDDLLPLDMIGIKKIQGGALEVNDYLHTRKWWVFLVERNNLRSISGKISKGELK